jgi:NADH dehydrogenase FAD-containing subunit
MHGQLAAKNIQALMEGKPLNPWKPNGGMEVLLCLFANLQQ